MSSWFDTGLSTLNSLTQNVTESVQQASKQVQDALPKEHQDLLAKLTLNTDEMKATRQEFSDEAQRKADAQNRLGQLLPWETKDVDREILVDECKDAILELSKHIETFHGPYEIPMINVHLEDDDDDEDEEEGNTGGDDDVDVVPETDAVAVDGTPDGDDNKIDTAKQQHPIRSAASQHYRPSAESKEKLAKLQPLPPLLEEFDLDSHVGLIQRLLKEDPELVKKQASLSGGGPRERVFWQNYFFHCAFTRYEAGLSIDEIWSYQKDDDDDEQPTATDGTTVVGGKTSSQATTTTTEEETVVFKDGSAVGASSDGVNAPTDGSSVFQNDGDNIPGTTESSLAGQTDGGGTQSTNGFELVGDEVGNDVNDVDDGIVGDPELDELEAEIARELEDM